MPSEAQQEEMEERAKEILEEFDEPFEVAMYATKLEVHMRENMAQLVTEYSATPRLDIQLLHQAAEEGELLAWLNDEYEGDT